LCVNRACGAPVLLFKSKNNKSEVKKGISIFLQGGSFGGFVLEVSALSEIEAAGNVTVPDVLQY